MKLIIGKLNSTNQCFFWNIDESHAYEIGDYAIVENKDDYDLIKIIGEVETLEKYVYHITHCKVNKNVKYVIKGKLIKDGELVNEK